MKHFIIGTAGHVDHGKTMLIKALTGKDTDRLKEEKERGISIELGFAPFKLPGGSLAGVVDVPGHERFIKNMLAGVGGMDLVLLVVAADEGMMPQSKEHLEIIDLLQVPRGIIVINKVDLVDEEWLEMVKAEVIEQVKGTVLEHAPVVEVSAVTGKGIPELKLLIDEVAAQLKERPEGSRTRMPIDRVFTVTGFGTVLTGTLTEGYFEVGKEVEILPQGIIARIRGLQVHGQKVERASAGQRVAVNLSNIERESIHRGSVLAAPGKLKPSHRLDVNFKLLDSADKPLANRVRVRVHIGTAEILARIILLETDEIEPGATGYAQLECEELMTAAKGDLLVVRSYSPMRTIGGARVIDPSPVKHRRKNQKEIEDLKTKEKGTPQEILEQAMITGKLLYQQEDLSAQTGLQKAEIEIALEDMAASETVRKIEMDGKRYYILETVFSDKENEIVEYLGRYHQEHPLRAGISKELIRGQFFKGLNNKLYNALLNLYQQEGRIQPAAENLRSKDFEPKPDVNQAGLFKQIEQDYVNTAFQTPFWEEIISKYKLGSDLAEDVLDYFVGKQVLVTLDEGVILHKTSIDKAKALVTAFLREKGEITLAEIRDLLNTSRRYALPITNYFDKQKITRRVEDKRVLY